jgi:hypothetical protein
MSNPKVVKRRVERCIVDDVGLLGEFQECVYKVGREGERLDTRALPGMRAKIFRCLPRGLHWAEQHAVSRAL